MRQLMAVAIATLVTGSACHAGIVIDDFSTSSQFFVNGGSTNSDTVTLGNGVIRTVSMTNASSIIQGSVSINGAGASDLFEVTLPGGGSVLNMTYDLDGIGNPGFFIDHFLSMGFADGTNPFDLVVSWTGTVGTGDSVTDPGRVASSGPFGIDLLNPDGGHLSGLASVDTLTVSITNNNADNVSGRLLFSGNGGILGVPEPTSAAFLLLTAVAGVGGFRRRRTALV